MLSREERGWNLPARARASEGLTTLFPTPQRDGFGVGDNARATSAILPWGATRSRSSFCSRNFSTGGGATHAPRDAGRGSRRPGGT